VVYWRPVYAFLRRQGAHPEAARDLTQGVFLMLLERNDIASIDPARGSFRSWLRTLARRYFLKQLAWGRARKRGREATHLSLGAAQERLPVTDAAHPTPDQALDRGWAQAVVARALRRLREECAREQGAQNVRELLDELSGEAGWRVSGGRPNAAELAEPHRRSPGALRTQRCRSRAALAARLGKLLRDELAPTAGGTKALGEEVRELLAAFS
jgi:RNA polymerase sigma-70 factor (ECF subfamily)